MKISIATAVLCALSVTVNAQFDPPTCREAAEIFRAAAAEGSVINRRDQRYVQGNIARVENAASIPVDPRRLYPNTNSIMLVTCHATLVMDNGQRLIGVFTVEQRGGVMSNLITWTPD